MISLKKIVHNPFIQIKEGASIVDLLFTFIIFLLNPTLGLVVSIFKIASSSGTERISRIYTFYFILAAWLGVLNMTKSLFSDQIYYAKIFLAADTSNILLGTINYREGAELREPFFNLLSVICRFILGPNTRAYFFICTFIFYLFQYLALDLVLRKSKRSDYEIICAVLLLSFFTPLFIQSIHALRQNLAISIVIYAIAYKSVYKKHLWFFYLLSFFTHNMSMVFIIFALIPWVYKIINLKKMLIICVGYFLFLIVYNRIGSLMVNSEMASMSVIGKTLSSKGDVAEFFSLYALMLYGLPTLFVAYKIIYRNFNNRGNEPLLSFAYLVFFLFILILSFPNLQTLQARYGIVFYSFIPFIILFLYNYNNKFQNIYCTIITGYFCLRFFFIDINWNLFADWSELLTYPFYHFWTTEYYLI